MLTRPMNVGEYIFTADGRLARITKINKTTYTYEEIGSIYNGTDNVKFDGIKHYYYGGLTEWFECDDAQAKALELAKKKYKAGQQLNETKEEIETLLGKVKYFLNQISNIAEIEVNEEEY